MAITYGFYNSMNGDRKYNAFQMSSIFDGVIRDGVFQSIGGYLATKPGEGMQVIVSPGKAWFDHTWTVNDADLPLEIAQSDLTLSRYDAVVLETDATKSVRENSIKVLKGTPASDPQKPTLINKGDVHQHPLAYILVPGGSSSIQVQNIDIMVGKTECPFVTSILESVSIEVLLAKWEGEFRVWFDELQNQMAGDVATNLQNQITRNAGSIGDIACSYNSKKSGPWLVCGGLNYDKAQHAELYALMKREASLEKGWSTIPLVDTVVHIGEKSFYFSDQNIRTPGGREDRLIMYPSDIGLPPEYDSGIDLYALGFLKHQLSAGAMCFSHANGYYIIASNYSDLLYIAYSKDGKNWTFRRINKASNVSYGVSTVRSIQYIDDKYYVFAAWNNQTYVFPLDIMNATEYNPTVEGHFMMGYYPDSMICVSEDGNTISAVPLITDGASYTYAFKLTNSAGKLSVTSNRFAGLTHSPRIFEIGGVLYGVEAFSHTISYDVIEIQVRVYKEGSSVTLIGHDIYINNDRGLLEVPPSHVDVIKNGDVAYIFVFGSILKFKNETLTVMESKLARPTGSNQSGLYSRDQKAHFVHASVTDRTITCSFYQGPSEYGCATNSPEVTPYVQTENGEFAYIRSDN